MEIVLIFFGMLMALVFVIIGYAMDTQRHGKCSVQLENERLEQETDSMGKELSNRSVLSDYNCPFSNCECFKNKKK